VRVLVNAAVLGLVPVPVATDAHSGSDDHRATAEHPGYPPRQSAARLSEWVAARLAALRGQLGGIGRST
jgi:hypothetical protein